MVKTKGIRWRLFITAWLVFGLHFATNIVREHYPAFSVVEKGTFQVDEFEGFHPDIFRHTDGHAYIGNQVAPSLVAAVPLILFDPALEKLQEYREENPVPADKQHEFDTEYPRRAAFLAKVRAANLDLRFGGAAVVTSVFLMAPLLAWFVVYLLRMMQSAGVSDRKALVLALLAAFATPIFYRAAHLNHNVFLMIVIFLSFALLWNNGNSKVPWSVKTLAVSGFFSGVALAFDYAGVVPLVCFFAWVVLSQLRHLGWREGLVRSWPFVLGTFPPVAFLLFSQWKMFGDPFLPGQFWMPDVNYTDQGWRGFGWPRVDIFWRNLTDPNFGLLAFAPLLYLGFLPFAAPPSKRLFNGEARWTSTGFVACFLIFCAANRYSLMQWNSGFRYLLPVVPFLFFQCVPHLRRLSARTLLILGAPFVLHSWVLSMARFTPVDFDDSRTAVGESWVRFVADGVQLPWLTVLRNSGVGTNILEWWGTPLLLVGSLAGLLAWIWMPVVRESRTA